MILRKTSTVMWRILLVTETLLKLATSTDTTMPVHHPTKGAIWPRPSRQDFYIDVYRLEPRTFQFQLPGHSCSLIEEAIKRSIKMMHKLEHIAQWYEPRGDENNYEALRICNTRKTIEVLIVDLEEPCEEVPYYNMIEDYELTIANTCKLKSKSVWGIIRGLESFSQSFYVLDIKCPQIFVNGTYIVDYPRFPHRGVMIDTARHYISVSTILNILEAMAMNKMNVLHWHLTDDESFSFESLTIPELSIKGAFTPRLVYRRADVETIVKFAISRGIRVVPEFDMPSHSRSWGLAIPDMLARCYQNNQPVDRGPMNPIRNATYSVLEVFLKDAITAFPESHIHLGGDEVNLDCWKSNPNIADYMHMNMVEGADLYAMFLRKVMRKLPNNIPIIWHDIFEDGVRLPKETIIQMWSNVDELLLRNILESNHSILFSTPWNLDDLDRTFSLAYNVEPLEFFHDHIDRMIGGEALLWGEYVDERNILQRLWPRASAVAEKLWSPLVHDSNRRRLPTKDPKKREVTSREQVVESITYPLRTTRKTWTTLNKTRKQQPTASQSTPKKKFTHKTKLSNQKKRNLNPKSQKGPKYQKGKPMRQTESTDQLSETSPTGTPGMKQAWYLDDMPTRSAASPFTVGKFKRGTTDSTKARNRRQGEQDDLDVVDVPVVTNSEIASATMRRLAEHVCRMQRLGIPAQPLQGPGYCFRIP